MLLDHNQNNKLEHSCKSFIIVYAKSYFMFNKTFTIFTSSFKNFDFGFNFKFKLRQKKKEIMSNGALILIF